MTTTSLKKQIMLSRRCNVQSTVESNVESAVKSNVVYDTIGLSNKKYGTIREMTGMKKRRREKRKREKNHNYFIADGTIAIAAIRDEQ